MKPLKILWAGGTVAYHTGRNQFFKRYPRAAHGLLRLGRISGRGPGRSTGASVADYFHAVASDYEHMAAYTKVIDQPSELFAGRRVLELGPGNTRSVALLGRGRGAAVYEGFDAFDVQSRSRRYLASIYEPLMSRAGIDGGYPRARELLQDVPVHHDRESLLRGGRRFDLVVSRAVLEHVADLDELFADLDAVTTDDAVQIHKVDLRCHGTRFDHDLDFLMFSERVYRSMASHVGMPNRVRIPGYLDLGDRHGYVLLYAGATHRIAVAEVQSVREQLAEPFRAMPPEVLAVLGVWLVFARKGSLLARAASGEVSATSLPPAPAEILSAY